MAEIALPHSVWTLIFERLSLQELSRTSTVSQQWHKLIWSTVHDLTVPNKFRPKSDQKFSNASLEKIAVYCSNVRHLDLSGINGFTDEGVKSLGRLTSLRSLNLSRCLRISNSVLADVLSPMDSLQSLNVSFCTQFTDELFQKLAKSHKVSRSLTSLDVSFCVNLTNQTLVGALVKFENLQAVALNGCDQLSRKAINEMIASLPKLDTLEVRWIQFKEPRRQDSPLFASPVRSTSSAKPLNVSYIPLSKEVIPKIVAQLASPNPRLQLEVAIALRMLLSCDSDPPIDAVVNAGAVPKLVNHLSCKDPMMQLEAVWSLTNIASGTSAHTQLIIDNHALPVFVKLTESKEPEMAAKAIWTLGNIAGDSVKFRDLVLHHGTLLALLYNMDVALSSNNITLLRNATWCLSNLSRGTPKPPFALFRPALPKLAMLLSHRDEEVVIDSCWAASYLSDGPNEHIEDMLQAGVIESVVRLLNKGPAASLTPALRTIGNVATGNDSQTQRLLSMGVLPNLLRFLSHGKKGILKETCWTISNITAGPAHHLQVLFDAGVMSAVLNLLRSSKDFDIKKEAAWAIGNATLTANSSQIESLVSLGCIHELVEFLGQADNNVGSVLLDALKNIMVHNKTKYLGIMRSLNKTSYFEELAHSENDDLCAKALDMISWLNGKYK